MKAAKINKKEMFLVQQVMNEVLDSKEKARESRFEDRNYISEVLGDGWPEAAVDVWLANLEDFRLGKKKKERKEERR